MAPTAEHDGAEDVNDFLLRIRELGDKRDKEDEERTKKLEEEILQGRKERQARRAERARSISPTKDSPVLQDISRLSLSLGSSTIDPPESLRPSSQTPEPDTASSPITKRDDTLDATQDTVTTPRSRDQSAAASPAPNSERTMSGRTRRSGTLSWQQRPASRDLRSGLSSPARESSLKLGAAIGAEEPEASKDQIASSLASKDPSWFRQTADRGIGSPALRKSPEDAMSDTASISGNTKLPGLGEEESTTGPEKDMGEDRSRSPSRASSTFGTNSVGNRYSSVSSVSTAGGLGSPFPLSNPPKLEARKVESSPPESPVLPVSPSQRRGSPERPVSPTKGLGGFVQSAMMKRSDSVTKRWSAQASPGLNRGNSTISTRSSVLGDSSLSVTEPKFARENSPLSTSRPGSSHSEATVVHHMKGTDRPGTSDGTDSKGELTTNEGFVKPSFPAHSRSSSKVEGLPPLSPRSPSPSKTMDPKRWSPTKASWLESALNRPESPKQSRGSTTAQPPAWLKELNQNRRSRGSVDLGRPNSFKEVTPTGLMRSPPPGSHYKKPSISGISETLNSPEVNKTKELEAKPPADKHTDVPAPGSQEEPPKESPQKSEEILTEEESKPSKDATTPPRPSAPALSSRPGSLSGPSGMEGLSPKPKPQSPAMDLRANLRRRELPSERPAQEEPEFKNVFGKLRKAETKNYVPPDELKDNILKGKAALNNTGGFKKAPRVDPLKESIVKQKEAMKASGGSLRRPGTADKETPAPEPAVPEAIARRNNLSRSDSSHSNLSSGLSSPAFDRPQSTQSAQSWRDRQSSATEQSSHSQELKSPGAASTSAVSDATNVETADDGQDASPQAELGAAEADVKQKDSSAETIQSVRALPSRNEAGAAKVAAATQGLATKGTLADRINPALAGFLSRGPPGTGAERSSVASTESVPTPSSQQGEPTPSASLTHMTKGRARGPKRRLPNATGATAAVNGSTNGTSTEEEKPEPTKRVSALVEAKRQSFASPTAADKDAGWPLPKPLASRDSFKERVPESPSQKATSERPKPEVVTKSHELRKASFPAVASEPAQEPKQDAIDPDTELLPSKRYDETAEGLSSQVFVASTSKEKPEGELQGEPEEKPQEKVSEKSQQKSPEKLEETDSQPPPPPPKSVGLPFISTGSPRNDSSKSPARPTPSPKPLVTSFENRLEPWKNREQKSDIGLGIVGGDMSPKSPQNKALPSLPVPPKKAASTLGISIDTGVDPNRKPSLTSPIPRTTESTETIHRFFETFPKPSDRVDIDPQTVLNSRERPKIRTVKKQIWEITGDGKKQDLPVNQEYILYEGSMYLCVHVFEAYDTTKTEVHLWCGDDVGEAAIEDAQLFARKVARDHSCKLELMQQGKETATFIQALGGIIITRRGSGSRSSSSALYMLCGRRHLGQIVFDEVDFSRKNLCSGYPFVISARFGKLYLWKGQGSGADEVGGARLIGMDLGLTGEIEEVDEGKEPDSFFEIFPDHKETTSHLTADHWHLKPKYGQYYYRLLRVDHELGQRTGFWSRRSSSSPITRPNDVVQEIEPFSQKDIAPQGIYILDAFFELYVIVGEHASSRSADFASALFFAHEYGIMAVSLEDRPFIPRSYVAIGGVPESCKTVFRKWDRRDWNRAVKVLPLNAAIEAIRS
ncbi:gelsolin repeat protein, putative [Paecilomyces variotii No. 5]|uniref:Gelsolin repeat protein, putative n=1 Tax=Byssochlamys spectabilis (strain No. 5 / NBRC 109023) TaxID=1356009 RepID=V5G0D1_BYSSN|nr:gelsolin repeat protein, putative [Paecilomyces variotii No. 5]